MPSYEKKPYRARTRTTAEFGGLSNYANKGIIFEKDKVLACANLSVECANFGTLVSLPVGALLGYVLPVPFTVYIIRLDGSFVKCFLEKILFI